MSKDYYKILGVERSATKEEIKKAYKTLAKKYHPDLNKADASTEKFKEINEAAAVLADDEKRSQFDKFGTAADQFGQGQQGFDFSDFMQQGNFDFDSIFESFFGGSPLGGRRQQGRRKGSDLRYEMDISLEDAATGVSQEVNIPRLEQCSHCHGSGAHSASDIVTCPDCDGQGMVRRTQRTPFGMFATTMACGKCRGAGKSIKKECHECDGTGLQRKTRKIKVEVPAGAEEETNLRLRGEGEAASKGGEAGDLYIVIHVKEHDIFERRGDDIYTKITIPFALAALGGEIEVPTLSGKATLKIHSGTQSNTIFKMKNKGIPFLHGHGHGDENIEVVVDVPKSLTKKQKELLRDFQEESKDKKGFFKFF